MAKEIGRAVREVCLWLPQAEEFLSHGSPNFRVRGKTFATYVINHHGDGRVALWLNAPNGSQDHHTTAEPKHFFVPPYVGPRGWLGVNLDKGISWKRVASLVREAYEQVAPKTLSAAIGKTIEIKAPTATLAPSQLDPMRSARAQRILKPLRKIGLAWPETSEGVSFGFPIWRAGKKTFASAYFDGDQLLLSFWVGALRQALLTADPRLQIPAYMGHNGWIALNVTQGCDWDEVRELALYSYKHFALKRMLRGLTEH